MPIVDGRIPDAGDIFWVDFGEPRGHAQAGRRPAIVLSSAEYNEVSSVLLVCPVTSRTRSWPFSLALPPTGGITGYVLVDQVQALDPITRPSKFAGAVPAEFLALVRSRLASLLEIRPTKGDP